MLEWSCVAALGAACLSRVLTSDFLARAPVADRGFFIAAGRLIADGAVMYRDIFDNKPPVIYLLSALGWWLTPDARSVFIIERVALGLLVAALFAMLRYGFRFGLPASLAGLVVALITLRNPEIFNGGHLTEEYGILFEAAGIGFLGIGLERMRRGHPARSWGMAAGTAAGLMMLTRQSFLASLVVLWVVIHVAYLSYVRERRERIATLILWELLGFAIPLSAWLVYLWWVDGLRAFFELVPDTFRIAAQGNKGPMSTRLVRGLGGLGRKMFQDDLRVETAAAAAAIVAVIVAQWRDWRGISKLGIPPLALPLWFAAELVAASAPGDYYGHYYMPFVPLWACTAALIVELFVPRGSRWSWSLGLRATACAVLLVAVVAVLDARYRADPIKYWFINAPGAHLPPDFLQTITDGAKERGWQSYVPLDTMATHVLLDMPLRPGTRFLAQYQYQFPGPDSPRGSELLADIGRADIVVEDVARLRLDPALERRIRGTLQTSFTPFLHAHGLQIYARTNPSDRPR